MANPHFTVIKMSRRKPSVNNGKTLLLPGLAIGPQPGRIQVSDLGLGDKPKDALNKSPQVLSKNSMQKIKLCPSNKKLKKVAIAAIVFLLLGAWFFYILWASSISARTILMPEIPEWTTYLVIGALVGIIYSGRAIHTGKTTRSSIDSFFGGFCLGFACSLNAYDVSTYLLPGETINYESAYEITFPGPAIGKFSHCEAGIWINDSNTHRRVELCINKSDLYEPRNRDMNAVWVTAHTNKIGSYIMSYTFFHK